MEELPVREALLPSGWLLEVWVGEWQPTAAGKKSMTACDNFLKVSSTIIVSASK